MREGCRRLVVLAFSVLLLAGLSPAPRDASVVALGAPSQVVATRTFTVLRATHTSERQLRRDDGLRVARDPRPFAPPPHLLAAARSPSIAPSPALEQLALADAARRTMPGGAPRSVRVRGPPALVTFA